MCWHEWVMSENHDGQGFGQVCNAFHGTWSPRILSQRK